MALGDSPGPDLCSESSSSNQNGTGHDSDSPPASTAEQRNCSRQHQGTKKDQFKLHIELPSQVYTDQARSRKANSTVGGDVFSGRRRVRARGLQGESTRLQRCQLDVL